MARDLERIRLLVGDRAVEVPLAFGARAYNVFVLLAGVVYAVLVGVALAIPLRVERSDGLVLGCAAAGLVFTVARIHTRQRKVVVILDQAGAREMDGDAVRLFIPWEQAYGFCRERRVRYRRMRQTSILVDLELASKDGRIAIANHATGFLFLPGPYFRSVARAVPRAVIDVANALPPIPKDMSDDRVTVARGGFVSRAAALLGFVIVAAGLWVIDRNAAPPHASYVPTLPLRDALVLSFILGFGALLSLVRPFVRMRRLAGASRPRDVESPYRSAGRAARPDADDALRRRQWTLARRELGVRLVAMAALSVYPLVLADALANECRERSREDPRVCSSPSSP